MAIVWYVLYASLFMRIVMDMILEAMMELVCLRNLFIFFSFTTSLPFHYLGSHVWSINPTLFFLSKITASRIINTNIQLCLICVYDM